jgi:hypothetical protein
LRRASLDFATVNVSSPNTESLRDLQGAEALAALLAGVMQARAELARPIPVFLKIAPDLSDGEIAEIAQVAKAQIDAIIATNTTITRQGLKSEQFWPERRAVWCAIVRKVYACAGETVASDSGGNPACGCGRHWQRRRCLCENPRRGQCGAALFGAGL